MALQISDEQINAMSTEEKQRLAQAIQQELQNRKSMGLQGAGERITQNPIGAMTATLGGALRGLSGQAPPAQTLTQPKVNPLDEIAYRESLIRSRPPKPVVEKPKTAQEKLAEIELSNIQGGTQQPIQQEEVPAGYTKVTEGKDKYGRPITKIVEDKTYRKPEDIIKLEDKEKQKKFATEDVVSNATDMLRTIQEVRSGLKYFGAMGQIPSLPTDYDRKSWEASVNNLLSKNIIAVMNSMKQASKTGATGFGQLNRSELQLIQSASNKLNRGLSPERASELLSQLEKKMKKVVSRQEYTSANVPAENVPVSQDNDPLDIL